MNPDNGNWLSAEQAVLPDGTLRENLPLVKKKLPLFSPQQVQAEQEGQPDNEENVAQPPRQD